MPIGRAILSSGTESPVMALKLPIKKSTYLKYPSIARLLATERIINSFEMRFFSLKRSMRSPKIYPSVIARSIHITYLGSPQA